MMFVSEWFYPQDRWTDDAGERRVGSWRGRVQVPEGTEVRKLANPPDPTRPYVEVVAPAGRSPELCGEGVHRNFHIDARRVKRIRFYISDEEHEQSKKRRPSPGALSRMQCPYALRHAKYIHWSIETEE